MDCKKVYDTVGSFKIESAGHATVKAMILLPWVLKDGIYQKLVVEKLDPINVGGHGYNGFLVVIKCEGMPDSLREETVSDVYPLEFTIKEEVLDFTYGKFVRLIVLHNNDYVLAPEDSPGLVPCAKTYMRMGEYDPASSFDNHPALPCVVPFGPLKVGGSIMPGS